MRILPECNTMQSSKNSLIFQKNKFSSSSGFNSKLSKKQVARRATYHCLPPSSCLAYASTQKLKAVYSSEILANFYQTTHCYTSTDSTHQNLPYPQNKFRTEDLLPGHHRHQLLCKFQLSHQFHRHHHHHFLNPTYFQIASM
jgi:hypothetical protein